MSCRVDTSPLIAGACVVSLYPGLGIDGATMRATTGTGAHGPGLLYNDWDAGDDAKEFRALIETPPAAGTFTPYEDGSFTLAGAADGSYSVVYRLFVDGADLGTATSTITVGSLAVLTPGPAVLSLTTFAPTLQQIQPLVPGAAVLSLQGFAPGLTQVAPGAALVPGPAVLTLQTFAPALFQVAAITTHPRLLTVPAESRLFTVPAD